MGFRVLVSRHPAIQTTELLTLAPAGLSPAEHPSLYWTHNRTCRSPASGSPTGFTVRHTQKNAGRKHPTRGAAFSPSLYDTAFSERSGSIASDWQLIRPRLFEPLRNNLRDLIRVAIHHHHMAVSLNPERRQIDPIGLHTSAGKGGVIAV